MLSLFALPAPAASRRRLLSGEKTQKPASLLFKARPRQCGLVLKAFFGKKKGNEDQAQEDLLASSWGGEQPDWVDSPDQRDVLEETWYEVNRGGSLLVYVPTSNKKMYWHMWQSTVRFLSHWSSCCFSERHRSLLFAG